MEIEGVQFTKLGTCWEFQKHKELDLLISMWIAFFMVYSSARMRNQSAHARNFQTGK